VTNQNGSVESLSALERTYDSLRQLILEGEFGPAERLTGARLSKLLGVSRTPVRAALVRLEAEGLVESTGGQSARVRTMTTSEVSHAYDVAAGLEGMLVYRLAADGTPEQFQEISDAVAEMERAVASGDKHSWVAGDMRFHLLIAEYGNNPLISLMMERVDTIIGRLRFLSLHVIPEGAQRSAHDHRAVSDAMSGRDGERARQLHQAHWERVREANTSFLQEGFSGHAGYLFKV
jgi:DNA-binding GntR family transcriptional regulator